MKRWPLDPLAVPSVFLGFALAVLWVRSYSTQDALTLPFLNTLRIVSWNGDVRIDWQNPERRFLNIYIQPRSSRYELALVIAYVEWTRVDPLPRVPTGGVKLKFWRCWFPDWFLLSLLWLPPALFLMRSTHRDKQLLQHLCETCGYDLRATPNRCPECGTIPTQKTLSIAES